MDGNLIPQFFEELISFAALVHFTNEKLAKIHHEILCFDVQAI